MNRSAKYFFAVAVILGLFNPAAGVAQEDGGLPANLGNTCLNRQKNAQGVRDGLRNDKVPNVCREEIQKQYEACNMAGADDDTGVDASAPAPTAKIRNGAEVQRNGLRIAATRNTAKSQLCAKARQSVNELCGKLEKDLRQAQINNSKEKTQAIGAVPPGPTHSAQVNDLNRRYSEIDRDLELQRKETGKVRATAETALDDNARCYGDVAQRDTFDAERAQEVLASANGDGPPPAEIKPTNVTALNENSPARQTDGVAVAVTDTVKSESEKAVLRTGVVGAFGEGSLAATGTRLVAGAATGVVGTATMGLGIFLGSTTSAGNACDMVYRDALSADSAGCRVSTRNTIQSLGSP